MNTYITERSKRFWFRFVVIRTGCKERGDAFAEFAVQLGVQGGGVLGVWSQVSQRILGDPAWNSLLDGAGTLDAQVETVAADDGAGSLPGDQGAVGADVSETHLGW